MRKYNETEEPKKKRKKELYRKEEINTKGHAVSILVEKFGGEKRTTRGTKKRMYYWLAYAMV